MEVMVVAAKSTPPQINARLRVRVRTKQQQQHLLTRSHFDHTQALHVHCTVCTLCGIAA